MDSKTFWGAFFDALTRTGPAFSLTNNNEADKILESIKKELPSLVSNNMLGQAAEFVKDAKARLINLGFPELAAKVCENFALELLTIGDIGWGYEFANSAVECYKMTQNFEAAIQVCIKVSKIFLRKHDYGRAYDEYYRAIMVYIAQCEIEKAIAMLQKALEVFRRLHLDGYFIDSMSRHLEILTNQDSELLQEGNNIKIRQNLSILKDDFQQMLRHDWVRSCDIAISKLS